MVSSTAMPIAITAIMLVEMFSVMPVQPINPNKTMIGRTLGTSDSRPARTDRKISDMIRKRTTRHWMRTGCGRRR